MKAVSFEVLNHIVIATNNSLGSMAKFTSLLQRKMYRHACYVSFPSHLFHGVLYKNVPINMKYKFHNCICFTIYFTTIAAVQVSGFGGPEVACWPLVPKFAGSNPTEAVGFFRAKKSSARLPSEGK